MGEHHTSDPLTGIVKLWAVMQGFLAELLCANLGLELLCTQ